MVYNKMAEYKMPTLMMLFALVLIFYLGKWQDSKQFLTPVPVTFREPHSLNLRRKSGVEKNTSKAVLSVNMIKISNELETTVHEPKSNKSGNGKTVFDHNFQIAPKAPRVTQSPHLTGEKIYLKTSKDVRNIDVVNVSTNGMILEKAKFNASRNSKSTSKDTHQLPSPGKMDVPKNPCIKQIQQWAGFTFKFPETEYDCPAENCKARFVHSNSYDKLKTSHAVILHHKGSWKWEELERYRPVGQMWIYMTKESPLHSRKGLSPEPQRLDYNWSMTYHTESDFVIPYGKYFDGDPEVPANDNRNWAAGKTRIIAWMASNCGISSWARTKFVRNLENLIQVDSYGACGKLKCPRDEKCDEILSSHKFYLALENSECQDYITEKFWKNAFTHHLVPIVYGTTREDYEKVAPPYSFIHLSDFKNMTSLVDYIKYLDKNDTAYNEYFNWRKLGSTQWYNEAQVSSPESLLCSIVHKLRENDERKTGRIKTEFEVGGMRNWFRRSCKHRRRVWGT